MSLPDWNELSLEELERLHDEEKYQYLISDGRIDGHTRIEKDSKR